LIDGNEIFKTSLKNTINTIRLYNRKRFKLTIGFFNYNRDNIIKIIEEYLEKLESIQIKIVLKIEFYNIKTDKCIDHFIQMGHKVAITLL
jgi:predicted AAA+ superfamily ATPase